MEIDNRSCDMLCNVEKYRVLATCPAPPWPVVLRGPRRHSISPAPSSSSGDSGEEGGEGGREGRGEGDEVEEGEEGEEEDKGLGSFVCSVVGPGGFAFRRSVRSVTRMYHHASDDIRT